MHGCEDPSPVARTIIERARPFLEGELTPPGIRNYFAEGGPCATGPVGWTRSTPVGTQRRDGRHWGRRMLV